MRPYLHVLFAFDGTLLGSASLIVGSSGPAYPTPDDEALTRPYPGVCDVVLALRAAGARLGLVTTKDRTSAARGLAVLGLARCFDAIVAAEDVAHDRPDAEPIERALALLGADRRQTILVGDEVRDIEAGARAGVRTAAVLWGPCSEPELSRARPDFLVEDIDQLRALLGI